MTTFEPVPEYMEELQRNFIRGLVKLRKPKSGPLFLRMLIHDLQNRLSAPLPLTSCIPNLRDNFEATLAASNLLLTIGQETIDEYRSYAQEPSENTKIQPGERLQRLLDAHSNLISLASPQYHVGFNVSGVERYITTEEFAHLYNAATQRVDEIKMEVRGNIRSDECLCATIDVPLPNNDSIISFDEKDPLYIGNTVQIIEGPDIYSMRTSDCSGYS